MGGRSFASLDSFASSLCSSTSSSSSTIAVVRGRLKPKGEGVLEVDDDDDGCVGEVDDGCVDDVDGVGVSRVWRVDLDVDAGVRIKCGGREGERRGLW